MKKHTPESKCKHKWIPLDVVEYRDQVNYHWHKVHKAMCQNCAEVKVVSDQQIKDFI